MEFLRDPIWQFVGAALTLITIFFSVYFFSAQRSIKSLAYEVLTKTELLSVKKEIKGKVQVLFEGKPVENVYLVLLKITNDGRVPIAASHFERPLSFSFGENASLLSADITSVFPSTLKPLINIHSNGLVMQPTLLNSGDTIQITLLLAQHDGTVQADVRIEGVSEVKEGITSPLKPVIRGLIALGMTVLAGLLLVYIFVETSRIFINIIGIAILGMLVNIYAEIWSKKLRKALAGERTN